MDKISLGKLIKTRRKQLNISQIDIADYFNISVQAVSKWENGLSYPDFILLGDLSYLLKLNINDLLSLNNPNDEYNEEKKFNYQTFGENIKKYLKYYKFTQTDLEHKITSLNQSTISNIINGKAYPTITQFIELADLFKVSYNDLYYSIYNVRSLNINKHNISHKFLYIVFTCLVIGVILFFSLSDNNNNKQNNNSLIDDKYKYIEFWDENNNLIDAQKIANDKKISYIPEIYIPFGWNKDINTANSSKIFKMNKNPVPYYFRIHTNKGDTFVKCYDDINEFNMYELYGSNYYVTSLYDDVNAPFTFDNIKPGVYELYGNTKVRQYHTISFPIEFGLSKIELKDCEPIPELPMFSYNDYLITGWSYNNKKLEKNKPYSFEQSIEVLPIYHNQETQISTDGMITNLISNEEAIIIPDTINNIRVTGINENAIKLQKENSKIIFMNRDKIYFSNIFYNKEYASNIKNIEIMSAPFTQNSNLEEITNLDSIKISSTYESINEIYPIYQIESLFNKASYHINNIYFDYFSSYTFAFKNTNVDNVYYTGGGNLVVDSEFFKGSNLRNLYFKSEYLAYGQINLMESCFKDCCNLITINLPSITTLYGDNHFFNCESLENINIYGSLNYLSNNMFSNTNIKNLYIKEVTSIKSNAFNNMPLEQLEIANQTSFDGICYLPDSLKNIYIGGTYDSNINIQSDNKYLTVHYTDENILAKSKFNSSTFKVCLDCVCLHKGEKDDYWTID